MLQIKKILHAHDFSPAARTALKYATRLSNSLSIPLDVLHVIPSMGPTRFVEFDPTTDETVPDETLRSTFDDLQASVEGPIHAPVRYLLARSPLPGPAILEHASKEMPNLIIIGAHGSRAAEKGQLGSVASELIQRSTCPVMIVPERVPKSAADEKVERIVTYISFAHLVEPVIIYAFRIARVFGAHLDVLALTKAHGAQEEKVEDSPDAMQTVLHRQLLRAVEAEAKENGVPFEDVDIYLRSGHASETILGFAKEHRSDLILVEAPGLAAVESPLGRMVERIVNDAPCPVIIVNTCGQPFVRGRKRRRASSSRPKDVSNAVSSDTR